jgi:hypothetical protein
MADRRRALLAGMANQARQGDPMKSILDPSFRYTPSVQTDLRKTFAKIRREQGQLDTTPIQALAHAGSNVLSIQKPRERLN